LFHKIATPFPQAFFPRTFPSHFPCAFFPLTSFQYPCFGNLAFALSAATETAR
jgi:hypothetical protein